MSRFWRMAGVLCGAATLLLSACGQFNRPKVEAPIEGASFAVVDVRVFDGLTTIPKATVVVRDGLIESVGEGPAPKGLPVVKGAGKTLMPGLIDAHVHAFDVAGLEDALRLGVTTELDHFTAHQFLATRKAQRTARDKTAAADLFSSGTLVTSPGGHGTQFGLDIPTIAGPEEAEAFVKARLAEGSDWIKIAYEPGAGLFTSVSRETLAAVVKAAQDNGVLAVVHVSSLEAARDAAAVGADGLVHIFADQLIDDALLAEMKAKSMFVIPTLSVVASAGDQGDGAALAADARLGPYLSEAQKAGLAQGFGMPADNPYKKRFNMEIAAANVLALHKAGVRILAGTDAPNPGTAYGVSMHGELKRLVAAGLSPADALAAATSVAASAFKIPERGRIAPGARADLLLVDGDPTADIEATRAIARLFKNGYEIERKTAAESKSAAVKPELAAGLVSDFETDLGSGFGQNWEPTTDQIARGASTAALSRVAGANGSQGALRVDGVISTKFFFPWSGAGVYFSADLSKAYDLSGYSKISFMARGAERKYALMAATRTSKQRPAMEEFELTGDWRRVEIPLASIRGAAPEEVYWIAVTAGRPAGYCWFEIDDVKLE